MKTLLTFFVLFFINNAHSNTLNEKFVFEKLFDEYSQCTVFYKFISRGVERKGELNNKEKQMVNEMKTLSKESEINMFFFAQELKIPNENVQKNIEKIYESFLNTYGYDHLKIDILMEKHFANCENSIENPKERTIYWFNFNTSSCIDGDCVDGYGTKEWDDGTKYVGEYKNSVRNGLGTETYPNGDKYVGEFKDSERNGQGTYINADGSKYVGEFKDGESDGLGTHTFLNGGKYVGEHKNGERNGQGTYTYPNGDKYVGEYKNSKFDGQGTYTFADGTVKKGIFENDELVTPN